MDQQISVATMKSRFSEMVAQVAYSGKQFVITRRNKPVAALVSLEALRAAKRADAAGGLAAVADQLQPSAEWGKNIDAAYKRRHRDKLRRVSL